MFNNDLMNRRRTSSAEAVDAIWESVAELRRELVTYFATLSDEDTRAAWDQDFGRLHRVVALSGIRNQCTDSADLPLMGDVRNLLNSRKMPTAGTLLAAMLLFFSHEFGRMLTIDQIPDYLRDFYVGFSFEIPTVLGDPGEADTFAEYFANWLAYIHQNVAANPNSAVWRNICVQAATLACVIPAYFTNKNLRGLMISRARLIEQAIQFEKPVPGVTHAPRRNSSRIRLGILASHFGPHSDTFATLPVYRYLDRNKFEVILLSAQAGNHPVERFCILQADGFIPLPRGAPAMVQKVREADLDIAWIASNVAGSTIDFTLLAAHRLGRLQVASVPSCVTTGFKNIDCYVSGKLTEPAVGAQDHYSEKLLMIDGPAHCYDFASEASPLVPAETPKRAQHSIEENAIVFASGANFFKIVPELDDVWARILAAVPGSRLLLYPFNPYWSKTYPKRAFLKRAERNFAQQGVSADRLLIFDQAAARGEVLARLSLADIYLDSFPFAGVTSLLDPLALGIPTVVLDGQNFRSLMGPAFLRELKLDDFIASTVDDYIRLSIRLATDQNYRTESKARFADAMARGPRFLDARWYAAQIEKVLLSEWMIRTR